MSEANRGMWHGRPAKGFTEENGYRLLTGLYDHPLARRKDGVVAEHRVVLYEEIGPGSHQCHWCTRIVTWGGNDGIIADHLDRNHANNDPANLVPSCNVCNFTRHNPGFAHV